MVQELKLSCISFSISSGEDVFFSLYVVRVGADDDALANLYNVLVCRLL